MKVKFLTIVSSALFFLSAPLWAGYTLADLEILAKDGGHDEFFNHALDIRPSERQDTWKSMVSKMADQLTRNILKKAEINRDAFKKVESLYEWPQLQQDDVFKLRRQEIGVRYFKECLKKTSTCDSDLKAFWESNPSDPDTAMKLAELVVQYPNSPLPTWTFLEVALQSPLSEFYCKKEFVINAVWGKLEIDYIRLANSGDLLAKIDKTMHPDCLPSLNQAARERLLRPSKPSDRELAYQILKAQNKIDQKLSDLFFTVYLLERPSQGELFNYSWNRVKELGRTGNRRDQVLEELKKMDPLPDEILGSLDQSKKRIILNHFKANFPEYLDFYANQCIQFYGGKGSFPQGNPTIHCQDIMNSELAPQFMSEDKIKLYKSAKKI